MSTYLILTSKPGQYRSETGEALRAVETYNYVPDGRLRARFVLAEQLGASHVRIVDESGAGPDNRVPVKFLPTFDSLEAARRELEQLCRSPAGQAVLQRVEPVASTPMPAAAAQVRVTFVTNGDQVALAPTGSNLLRISLRHKGGIPFKCGGGLCGTCRCRIVQGRDQADEVKAKERRHLSEQDLADGFRLACQTFVHGDVAVTW